MPSANPAGRMLAEISNGLAQLHTQYYGRGPTRAKAYLLHDTVVCLLHEAFTTGERTLIDEGRAEAVREVRQVLQSALEDRFNEVVEKVSGRRVLAYMSQVHVDPDFSIELFVLEAAPGPGEEIIALHEHEVNGAEDEGEAAGG
jgi:uncharacterized protein YbcI